MKVFLSHSSMNKSNVKAIAAYLPKQIQTWLDENNLVWGSHLEETFESVIKTEMDYVLVFLSGGRAGNKWVLKELTWALEHEKTLGRRFVLPVIMPGLDIDPYEEYPEIANIKYIMLDNYEETGFKSCAEKISSQLFSLIIMDLENMHKPKNEKVTKTLMRANSFVEELCTLTYEILFKHREQNPITVEDLFFELSRRRPDQFTREDFPNFLGQICNMLSGIYYDGFELYMLEEHAQWKKSISADAKLAIAHAASRHVRSGMSIFIDAGSTMSHLVDILCKRLEIHNLSNIKIIVISTEHASKIADACARLGYDRHSSAAELYVPGGMVRPNTKAIVGIHGDSQIRDIIQSIGQLDLAFVGANGAQYEKGIYTHDNEELAIKETVLELAKQKYFAFDDTKCGLVLEKKLADFEDDVRIIINENADNPAWADILEHHADKIELVMIVRQ